MNDKYNIVLAVMFALLGAFFFATAGVFVKLIGHETTTNVIVFFRFFVGLLLLLPWCLKDKTLFQIKDLKIIVLRSIAGLLALFCMFYAIKYISLADALLLTNTNSLFVPIFAAIMLKTKTPLSIWIATLIGFLGVIFILHPDSNLLNTAALVGLASGLFRGFSSIEIRLFTKTNSTQQILFYYFFICSCITGSLLLFFWKTPSMQAMLYLIFVGALSAIFQIFFVLSLTYAPARIISVIMFSTVGFGVIFDWLYWHIVPNLFAVIGMSFIIVGATGVVYFGQKIVKN